MAETSGKNIWQKQMAEASGKNIWQKQMEEASGRSIWHNPRFHTPLKQKTVIIRTVI